jgi:hypothetical protein
MPLYEYSDTNGHVVELVLPIADRQNPGPCPECGAPLERVFLSRQQRAQRFQPIVLHVSPEGEFSFPMHEHAPVPEGFERREIRSFSEADQILRRVNAAERRKVEEHVESRQAELEYMESVNRSDLRRAMSSMSPKGRAFATLAMAVNDAKPRPRSFDPNILLEVREYDSSNREPQRDALTSWKTRRG